MRISKSEIKLLRSLSQKKFRDKERKFIVEGWRALKDVLNSGYHIDYIAMVARYADDPDYQAIVRETNTRKIDLKELSEIELRQVSDTVHSQGVIALVEQNNTLIDALLAKKDSLVVYADRISDPGNVGSIIRTCDWFGVDAIILSEGCVELHNEKVVRSTSGSIFHVPVVEHADTSETLSRLKKLGFCIVATAGDAKISYADARFKEKNALILGSEAGGISQHARQISDSVVKIPQWGNAESLNVGVACGIVLSHLRTNR